MNRLGMALLVASYEVLVMGGRSHTLSHTLDSYLLDIALGRVWDKIFQRVWDDYGVWATPLKWHTAIWHAKRTEVLGACLEEDEFAEDWRGCESEQSEDSVCIYRSLYYTILRTVYYLLCTMYYIQYTMYFVLYTVYYDILGTHST